MFARFKSVKIIVMISVKLVREGLYIVMIATQPKWNPNFAYAKLLSHDQVRIEAILSLLEPAVYVLPILAVFLVATSKIKIIIRISYEGFIIFASFI
jgi:hypothetical protein